MVQYHAAHLIIEPCPQHTSLSYESRQLIETHTRNMHSALSRFFNLPELIAELTSLLSRNEVSCLMQSSHTFCRVFEPFLYRQLELPKAWQSALVPVASFHTLARNTHHVFRWDTSAYDTAYVYNGLIAHQEQSGHFTSSAPGKPESRSSWLPRPDELYAGVTPILAMSNLHKLYMDLVQHGQPYPRMSTFQVQRSLFHASWIAQSCPVLAELFLDPVIISTHRDYQVLAASLNKKTRLEYLRLNVAPQ